MNDKPLSVIANEAKDKAQVAIVNLRKPRKEIGTRAIDKEVRGGYDILKTLQFWAVLGIVAKEYNLHRTSLVFLLGCYFRSEQLTKRGRVPSALSAYVKDYKGGYSKALTRLGFLDKSPGNEAAINDRGSEVIRRFISLVKYAQYNYQRALKRDSIKARKE